MRSITVVTTSRADYGIYRPILREIVADPALSLRLLVSGSHLVERFGRTVREIERDAFAPVEPVPVPLESDSPRAIAEGTSASVAAFAAAFDRLRPDVLVVLGDRFEMYGAAVAALPFKIPVAHIHGGELTEGAIDDALRHSMTKLSHLHFVATEEYARRVVQLGEEPWRVSVVGAPALDNLASMRRFSPAELEATFALRVTPDTVLVTFHPVTLEYEHAGAQADELLAALDAVRSPIIFTAPNQDTGGQAIRARIGRFVQHHPLAQQVESLGSDGYLSVLSICAAVVGNSSSGMIEAPSFGLPVVNVGIRQRGRVRGANVIDVPCERDAIERGIRHAIDPAFRASIQQMRNPYGDGRAAPRIVARLRDVEISDRLLTKCFYNVPVTAERV